MIAFANPRGHRKFAPVELTHSRCRFIAVFTSFLLTVVGLIGAEEKPAHEKSVDEGPQRVKSTADSAKGIEFFESKIRPVLVEHCYKCHSVTAKKSEGGLQLDTRKAIRAGGERGPAIVPGDAKSSILLQAVLHADSDLKMPPRKERLPAATIQEIQTWIEMGAPDPREGEGGVVAHRSIDIEAGRKFWSFQKPVIASIPVNKNSNWAKRDLDRFILAKLEATGLQPSGDADPAILLRRLYFDLIGMPPSPAMVKQFLSRIEADGLDVALEKEVDQLLASHHYGELWGRHWLDVARFAESSGKEANVSFPYAFRYRDYVIDAVNADIPYDRFLLEQIAGDLLPAADDKERARLLIATGFLAVGPKNLDEANIKQFEADVIDEQIDAVTRAVMANSVACARCHDHKFEPYSMQDYYALAGIFGSAKTYFGTFVSPTNRIGGDPLVLPRNAGQQIFHPSIPPQQVVKLKADLAELKKQQEVGMAAAMKAVITGDDPEKYFTLRDALRIFWGSGGIEGQLEKVDETGKALPLAMGVLDRELIIDAPLLASGEIGRPGALVPRGFPQVIAIDGVDQVPTNHSGRLEFARWLVHRDHPLTARVMANRIWKHLLGSGLVRTVDNFGTSGERSSHPELLDSLTISFVNGGLSTKKLVREIVLSRTYRQSSQYRADAFRLDPENRLLWRIPKRRLDAELIRDAMLVVSGELQSERPVGSLVAKKIGDRPISLIGLDTSLPADLDGSLHRSVYLPVLRDRLPDILDLFDFAEPSLVTGERETTNVPVQALYLMNGPFVQNRAKALAERIIKEVGAENQEAIRQAFLLCFGRQPDGEEIRLATEYLEQGQKLAGADAARHKQVLVSYCQALLATAEFRNLD